MTLSILDTSVAGLTAALGVAVAATGVTVTMTQDAPTLAPVGIGVMLVLLAMAGVGLWQARAKAASGAAEREMTFSVLDLCVAGLLAALGVVVGVTGVVISLTQGAPGVAPAGIAVMLAIFTAAAFGLRLAQARSAAGASAPNPGLAVLLVVNGVALFGAGWLLKQFIDPPGAGLVGLVMLVVNGWAAVSVMRRKP